MTRYRIIVKGRVQGVFFRASTRDEAKRLGITGFVKNLPDGNVLIEGEGEKGILDDLVAWCHKGPRLSNVVEVEVDKVEVIGYKDFEVRY